jgi:hypothetical protein
MQPYDDAYEAPEPVSVTGRLRDEKPRGPLEVESMDIRKADNGGYVVRTTKRRKVESAAASGGGYGLAHDDYQSTENVFTTWEEVMDFGAREFRERLPQRQGLGMGPGARMGPEVGRPRTGELAP